MQEVTPAGEDHRHPPLVRRLDDLFVAFEPPGCMTAVMPASARASTPSAKGKKASLAATAPRALSPAFFTAISEESTRLIWPAPIPTVAPSLARTMALLLTTRATRQAKRRSAICCGEGLLLGDDPVLRVVLDGVRVLEQESAGYVLGRERGTNEQAPA